MQLYFLCFIFLREMTLSITTDSEERFFLSLKYALVMTLMTFKWSCSWILQNNSLRGSIRAAWHQRIRGRALLVCVERVNFSGLEIFSMSQVTIHSACAYRNWGFFSPGSYTTAFPSPWDELNLFLQFEIVHKMQNRLRKRVAATFSKKYRSRSCWVKCC